MFGSEVNPCVILSVIFVAVAATTVAAFPQNAEIPDEPEYHPKSSKSDFSFESDFSADPKELDTDYWLSAAENLLNEKQHLKQQYGTAKNIILFLGDGMSIPTLAAARVEKGRRAGRRGPEAEQLSFEAFPRTGLSKTYCVDSQVADSACSATAYLCGVKTNIHTIGLNAHVKLNDCWTQNNVSNHVESISSWAQASGRSTGIVTTTRVTHASPAGNYAHIANRDWEWKAEEPCDDAAMQLVRSAPGKDVNVVLGGGWAAFLPKTSKDREGSRKDGLDLLKEWTQQKEQLGKKASLVFDREALQEVDYDKTEFLMGLFNRSHMNYKLNKKPDDPEPTLAEMTEAAIKILKKNPKGFFLFVEGGEIDFGHHENRPHHAIEETLEFSDAIERAVNLTSIDDTLIVVTADHAHTMSIAGYPSRGNDIFKTALKSDVDKKPIATLTYANGVGFARNQNGKGSRVDLSKQNLDDPDYPYPATAPLNSETHGGDDVGIFARGPWSHLFSGVIEQNVIPMAMARAGQIGRFNSSSPNSTASFIASPFLISLALFRLIPTTIRW